MTARGLVVDTEAQTSIRGALAFIEAGLKDDFDLTPVPDADFDLLIVSLNWEHPKG